MKLKKNKKRNSSKDDLPTTSLAQPLLISKQKKKKQKLKGVGKKGELIRRAVEVEVDVSNILESDDEAETTVSTNEDTSTIPKIRRKAANEVVEENFIIVPWASKEEWESTCLLFHENNFKDVIQKIAVWQKRVPQLPVGVEATLFLLEAIIYDQRFAAQRADRAEGLTEDQARSLYSLAIIRYLNHISHLATKSLGKSSNRLSRDLATIVDTPEWLVSLRNEVSHGASAPAIDLLRMGGKFVLQWLKDKYWKNPANEATAASETTSNLNPFTITSHQDDIDAPVEIRHLLTAFIASRIYKIRRMTTVSDPDIIQHISKECTPMKTKFVLKSLKSSLQKYLFSHSSVFCQIVSQELIPSYDFYESFGSILKIGEDVNRDSFVFKKLHFVWLPIINLLEAKGKLLPILSSLCVAMVSVENEKMQSVVARWIDKLLGRIEFSGKNYSKHLVKYLRMLMKHPNSSMSKFLDRLFRLTENILGKDRLERLESLTSIWLEADDSENKRKRKNSTYKLFSLDDIEKLGSSQVDCFSSAQGKVAEKWTLDERGEDFWQNIPLGAVLS